MIINHNLNAMNAHRMMTGNTQSAGKSMEKLSSGLRINRAGDDAAGLAISEKMRGQIRGLDQGARNAQDSISLIQTAEGALNETHSILQRMRELAVQSSNDTNTDVDRDAIKDEINQLTDEIDRIANTTEFNTKKLLDGSKKGLVKAEESKATIQNNSFAEIELGDTTSTNISDSFTVTITRKSDSGSYDAGDFDAAVVGGDGDGSITITNATTLTYAGGGTITLNGGANSLADLESGESITVTIKKAVTENTDVDDALSLQIGANSGQQMLIGINSMKAKDIGVRSDDGEALDVSDANKATSAISQINNAIETVSAERSKLGAYQNRLEHTINNLGTASENLTASESRVRDVDMAKEMMQFSKNNILSQAAQAMLAQANQQPQGVLQLLR